MKIGFYRVDNSLGYKRHTFDSISDKPEEIEKMLDKLPDGEVKVYDVSAYGWDGNKPSPNLSDFEFDYNDSAFDGGWWCVIIIQDSQKNNKSDVENLSKIAEDEELMGELFITLSDEIASDDEPARKKFARLYALYQDAPDLVNDIMMTLCGWTMETLCKKTLKQD